MFNNILVPLDGSKLAEAIIPVVEEIISGVKKSLKIEITLLQIVSGRKDATLRGGVDFPAVVYVPYTEAELEQIKKPIIEYLDKVAAKLNQGPLVTIKTLVKVSEDPADQILKTSEELKINLIAISTHGRSGITRLAFGSVADKVLKGGNTPVLMVRAAKQGL